MTLKQTKTITVRKGIKTEIPAGTPLELVANRGNTLIVLADGEKFSVNKNEVIQ